MKCLRARFPFRKRITGKGVHWLPDGTATRCFHSAVPEGRMGLVSNLPTRDAPQNQTTVPLRSTSTATWADTARSELPDQLSLAQQCMPSPTVGQIRRANARVRRAHQFTDLKLKFLSLPPEQRRFVKHTDYSSKDQDGPGRTQGGYIIGATDSSLGAGHVAPWSPLVWKSHKLKQGCMSTLDSEVKASSSGSGHLEWVMCTSATVLLFTRLLFGKQEHVHPAILSHQCHQLQERV